MLGQSYDGKDDDFLLALAARGDQRAIEALLSRYKDLVRRKASAMYMAGADAEDVIQEGMIGLYKAIRDFKPVHQVPFPAFASYCIMSQITDAVRQASRKKHGPLNESLSLNFLVSSSDSSEFQIQDLLVGESDPEEDLLDQENLSDLQVFFMTGLSKLEQQVVLLYLQQLSYQQIADCLSSNVKTVDNALGRARQKLLRFRKDSRDASLD